jgi:hypothetical protein
LEQYRKISRLYVALMSGLRGNFIADPSLRSPRVKPCGLLRYLHEGKDEGL